MLPVVSPSEATCIQTEAVRQHSDVINVFSLKEWQITCIPCLCVIPTGYHGLCVCLSVSPLISSVPPTQPVHMHWHLWVRVNLTYTHFPRQYRLIEIHSVGMFLLVNPMHSHVAAKSFMERDSLLAAPVCPQPIDAALLTTSGWENKNRY